MNLSDRIAALIEREDGKRRGADRSLRGIPPAVVKDMVRLTIECLRENSTIDRKASDLFADDSTICDRCDEIVRESDDGVVVSDNGWVECGPCVEGDRRDAAGKSVDP